MLINAQRVLQALATVLDSLEVGCLAELCDVRCSGARFWSCPRPTRAGGWRASWGRAGRAALPGLDGRAGPGAARGDAAQEAAGRQELRQA
eukprot:463558-Pyramimonas_sp.AAC.1